MLRELQATCTGDKAGDFNPTFWDVPKACFNLQLCFIWIPSRGTGLDVLLQTSPAKANRRAMLTQVHQSHPAQPLRRLLLLTG